MLFWASIGHGSRAEPSAEALRQACLAQESRISLVVPKLPSTRLESINVSNSGFLGPVALEFNLQYNALIGGRGTGKSSLLEYLRWGLCDQPTGEINDSCPIFSSAARVSLKTRYDQFKERSKSGSP
jgi:hypothetical protein